MLNIKFNLQHAAVALAAVCCVQTAQSAVLTFDDLPYPAGEVSVYMSATYNGFNFGNLNATGTPPARNEWFYSKASLPGVFVPKSGDTFMATCGCFQTNPDVAAPLPAGQLITSANSFIFNGAHFSGENAAAGGLDTTIQYQLFDSVGGLLFTSAEYTLTGTSDFYASGYNGAVNAINIVSYHGSFAMDDFTYQAPEPGALALVLMAGLAGVLATRRKG